LPELVRLEQVSRRFGRRHVTALDAVSLALRQGEMLAVTGPSGSGKSTLLRVMGALDRPDSGRVVFDGRDLYGTRRIAAVRARSIGFVFQFFHLLPTLTAAENVEVPMFGVESSHARRGERVRTLLDQVGLAARASHRPADLSGGECQRVAVARALANRPKLILADEPTGNLDSESAQRVFELLLSASRDAGAALVLVTHDPALAARLPMRIRMRDGRIEDAG
jgi:ABC-type lipoprotein export system ATPase subunit